MIPVVTPGEMTAIDRAAPEPVDVLIARAGGAVARCALDMLGGSYGRRVVVLAGKGNNGNDGREAARRLRLRGVRVVEIDALSFPESLPGADLVIDAAFGTGFRGGYRAPMVPEGTQVLAVDIPSGVDGMTGECSERVLDADVTITFAALKPGLLLGDGATRCGEIRVVDIGLDTSSVTVHLVEESDLAQWLPRRGRAAHKWQSAVNVIGGSPGMEGAAILAASAALRAGAGYARWSSPGGAQGVARPPEIVVSALTQTRWSDSVLADAQRFGALIVGNGLGLSSQHVDDLAAVVAGVQAPVVVDGDAISLLASRAADVAGAGTIFTPHDREFERLSGSAPGADRIGVVRDLAVSLGAVVLLKGPTTVVADAEGQVLVCVTGDSRLATLGTGDVLAGIIAALCARGLDPFHGAAAGAVLHGSAAALGWQDGMIAGDVVELIPEAVQLLLDGCTAED